MAWTEKRGAFWRVRYRDQAGVVRTLPERYFGKPAANDAALDLESDQRRHATTPVAVGPDILAEGQPPGLTLGEWAAKWREVHAMAPATREKVDQFLDGKILPVFAEVPLEEIKRLRVKEWATGLCGRHVRSSVGSFVTVLPTRACWTTTHWWA
ncbi:hypothetical protein Afil01_33690 [Actinorhabdospora filicis]|uniref:Integrase n=1 Tax=Actinorhabdospora filicis TaxID=1785913 RepID=A0A9W6W3U9_9ACTN|nr:hypothetical protein [Actinorhabdospora filicis]GLZ78562.1 hypothetical protein Afil01_33690 [Actinorhabdospora filicis]